MRFTEAACDRCLNFQQPLTDRDAFVAYKARSTNVECTKVASCLHVFDHDSEHGHQQLVLNSSRHEDPSLRLTCLEVRLHAADLTPPSVEDSLDQGCCVGSR